jgi:hypothetical protein
VTTVLPKGTKFAGFDLGTSDDFAGFFEVEFVTGRIDHSEFHYSWGKVLVGSHLSACRRWR